jgi:glycogen debranching enzyme
MLHYTPLQERGESDSPYSIRNQMVYDKSLFGGKELGERDSTGRVEEVLQLAKDEYGLLSLTDVVLNHTANDSPWLQEHPEAGFSPANTPHLTPAFELDSTIINFSAELKSKALPTRVTSESDVDALCGALDKEIRDLKLWQYYVLDVARERESIKAALVSSKITSWTGSNVARKSVAELADILRAESKIIGLGEFKSRYGVKVDSGVAAGIISAAFTEIAGDAEKLAEAWVRVVDVLNVPQYKEWEEDTGIALSHVRNRLKYTRLDPNGPKMGDISKE